MYNERQMAAKGAKNRWEINADAVHPKNLKQLSLLWVYLILGKG